MSTRPRLESAIEGESPNFSNVMLHSEKILQKFTDLYAEFWRKSAVSLEIKEMTRIRNARLTDCGYWKNVRFDSAREAGLTEEKLNNVKDGYEKNLDEKSVAALSLTDEIIGTSRVLDKEKVMDVKSNFREEEYAEISLGVGLFLGMSKVLIAFGLEPEDMQTTLLPTPGSEQKESLEHDW